MKTFQKFKELHVWAFLKYIWRRFEPIEKWIILTIIVNIPFLIMANDSYTPNEEWYGVYGMHLAKKLIIYNFYFNAIYWGVQVAIAFWEWIKEQYLRFKHTTNFHER